MSTKNSTIFSNIVQTLSLLILIFTLFFFIKPGINRVQNIIITQRDQLIKSIENDMGFIIKYESMSPLIFDAIDLTNVTISSVSTKTKLKISHFTLKIDLSKIFNPEKIIKSITISKGDFELDSADMDLFIGNDNSNKNSNFPFLDIKIIMKMVNVKVDYNDYIVALDDIRGSIKSKLARYYINLKSKLSYETTRNVFIKKGSTNIHINGYIHKDLNELRTNFRIFDTKSDIGTVKDLDLNIYYNKKIITIESDDELKYKISYNLVNSDVYLSLDGESIGIKDFFIPEKKFGALDSLLDSSFSGSLKLLYNINENMLLYSSKGKIYLNSPLLPLPITSTFHVIGDLDYVDVYYLNGYSKKGNFYFTGGLDLHTFFPNGDLSLSNIFLSEDVKLNSKLSINPISNNFVNVDFDSVDVGGVNIKDIGSIIYVDKNDISFKVLKSDDDGIISLSGNYNISNKNISSKLSVKDLNPNSFNSIIPNEQLRNMLNEYLISFKGDVNYKVDDVGELTYNISEFNLTNSFSNKVLELEGKGNNTTVDISHFKLTLPDIDVMGRIGLEFNNGETRINLDTLFNDNKYLFTSKITADKITIQGSYGFDASIFLGDTTYINLSATELPLIYKGFSIAPSFSMKSIFYDSNKFILSIPYFSTTIESDSIPFQPKVTFSLDGTETSMHVMDLEYLDNISKLNGDIHLAKEVGDSFSIKASLGGDNSESYSLQALMSPKSQSIFLDCAITNSNLQRFQVEGLKGALSLNTNIEGHISDFNSKGNISTSNLEYKNDIGNMKFDFSITDKLVSISNLLGGINRNNFSVPLLTYNYTEGQILGLLNFELNMNQIIFKSDLTVDLLLNKLPSLQDISPDVFNKILGKISLGSFESNNKELFNNKVIHVFNNKSAFQAYSKDKNLKLFYSYKSGLLNAVVKKPYFTALTANGNIKDGIIDLNIKDLDIDGKIIEMYMPLISNTDKRIVDIDHLDIRGQLNILGPLNNPLINGLLWTDTKIGISYITEEIEPIRINIRAVDNRFTLLPTEIVVGDKGVIHTSGELLFDSWLPESIVIDTVIQEEDKIPITYQYEMIKVEGYFNTPKTTILWDNSGIFVTGAVVVSDGEFYTTSAQPLDESSKEEESNDIGSFTLDVDIIMGTNNQFFLPNKNIPIVHATATTGDNIYIKYKSVDNTFSVIGTISIKEGEVLYAGEPFILKKGEVDLNLSQDNMIPFLKIIASKTVLDDDHPVEISLEYSGGVQSDFTPTFSSSDPSKSQADISSLLGLSIIGDKGGIDNIIEYTDVLSDTLISQPLENVIKKTFDLDYVNIESGFLSSYIITKFSFDETVDSVHNSDDNISALLNNNTITIGKFITDDFFIKSSVGTTYDNNQIGVDVGLSLTLNTPHFQLGFDLAPKMVGNVFSPEFGLALEWEYSPKYKHKGE